MSSLSIYRHKSDFLLESGEIIPNLEIAYHTFGQLNESRSNVVWVCHALTANSDVAEWWAGLFLEFGIFDPQKYFIVCANNLGSCYGTTGAHSIDSSTHKPWLRDFPEFTIRDMAQCLEILRIELKIDSFHTLIGGSMGGQIALEWILHRPNLSAHLILLATNAKHSAWGIAFNESQRLALLADAGFVANEEQGGKHGLIAARSIGLLSYRSYETYCLTQEDEDKSKTRNFKAASYQSYQGKKLYERFNPYCYYSLTLAMDSHNIFRNRNTRSSASLSKINSKTLVISIDSDGLFPPAEQKLIADAIPNSFYSIIHSDFGHDGFLIETKQISKAIHTFFIYHSIHSSVKIN